CLRVELFAGMSGAKQLGTVMVRKPLGTKLFGEHVPGNGPPDVIGRLLGVPLPNTPHLYVERLHAAASNCRSQLVKSLRHTRSSPLGSLNAAGPCPSSRHR